MGYCSLCACDAGAMWDATSFVWDVVTSACDACALCMLSHPLFGLCPMHRILKPQGMLHVCYVGFRILDEACCILCADYIGAAWSISSYFWAIEASVRDVAASVWDFSGAVRDDTPSAHAAHVGCCRRCVGCCITSVGCYSRHAFCAGAMWDFSSSVRAFSSFMWVVTG